MSTDWDLISTLQSRILARFDAACRDLPWRRERSPYRVWVSEVMLQQTRVATVVPYFEAWMERYPDVTALAAADEAEVLKSWEGLGYYSRVRNLHRAAQVVKETRGGCLPETRAELRALPGIGLYTAGAIASMAFGEPVPAVDGNVRRVLSRLFDLENPKPAELERLAAELVPPERPGDWNEALMEFGATVCLPRTPHCPECPLSDVCAARSVGTVSLRPTPRGKPRIRDIFLKVVVPVGKHGALFLVRRPLGGLLGGLWEFPQWEVPEPGEQTGSEVCAEEMPADSLADLHRWGLELGSELATLPDVPHVFTHLRATYRPVLVSASGGRDTDDSRWFDSSALDGVALPVAQRRIVDGARGVMSGASTGPVEAGRRD